MESSELYSDFKLTIDNCDAEPIHRPVAIQGHGYMLVFSKDDPDQVYAVSDGVTELFQVTETEIWKTPAKDWLPDNLYKIHNEAVLPAPWHLADPLPVELQGRSYNVIQHTYQDKYFLEIEPRENSKAGMQSSFGSIQFIAESISRQETEQALFQEMATQLKRFTGYDRVMVYRFDKDHNGHVVGEAKEDHLEPFLDLHYPATDIPEIARNLFLLNKSRIIPDIYTTNRWLQFNPVHKAGTSYLDLTYTQLRAISPIHIEYLGNIGVKATLVLAIIIENKLWGLFACHHYSPYFLAYEIRKTSEIIASIFAQRCSEVAKQKQTRDSQSYIQQEITFLSGVSLDKDINTQLIDKKNTLQQLCDADGTTVLPYPAPAYMNGLAPSQETLIQIRDWLVANNHLGVYVTDDLFAQVPPSIELSADLCGMLAISLTEPKPTFIFWFRKSQVQETYWGRKPAGSISCRKIRK